VASFAPTAQDLDVPGEAWRDGAGEADGTALALTLRRLAVTASEHMDLEERLVLPLDERHIFAAEWEAMEQHAIASRPLPHVQPGDRPPDDHPLDLRGPLEDGEDLGIDSSSCR
jgi:hypothetical protein